MKTNKNFDHEEFQNRLDLAAAYHLADLYGFSDIIWNHITCKTSSKKNTFLINQFGLRYDEVTASNLLEIDLKGNILTGEGDINFTGFVIHGAIHQTREDLNCVMHSHSRSGLAISCLKNGLEILIQDSAMFHNRISYHDWEGMSTSTQECESLARYVTSSHFTKNNKASSIVSNLEYRITDGKNIIIMDADLSADPSEFKRLIEKMPNFDIAIGSRLLRDGLPPIKRPWTRTVSSLPAISVKGPSARIISCR